MHEINPVLAGTFDAPNYAPSNNYAQGTNQTADTSDVTGPDDRRYTKFDHSDTDAGTASMSFSDLVDMFNPLEHIPVVSSVYRAITGEEINPVSRVAGDILYGGALGMASAVLGGVGAIADAGLEEETGKDSGGLAVAYLFGPDDGKDAAVQLVDAGTQTGGTTSPGATPPAPTVNSPPADEKLELAQSATTATPLLAALSLPANLSPPVAASGSSSDIAAPDSQAAEAPAASAASNGAPANSPMPGTPQNAAPAAGVSFASANAAPTAASIGGIPMAAPNATATGKKPFGGVMGVPNMQAQDMALSLSQGEPSMRMGHHIYTNQLASGSHSLPPMLSSGNARMGIPAPVVAPAPVLPASFAPPPSPVAANSAAAPSAGGHAPATAAQQSTAISATLMQSMMLKALSQYGTVASGPSVGPANNSLNFLN